MTDDAVAGRASIRRGLSASLLRALAGLAVACGITLMAGCTPQGVAVGNTQTDAQDVDHDSVDVADTMVGVVAGGDASHDLSVDRAVLDVLTDSGLQAVYAPAPASGDASAAARNGVRDFVSGGVNVIVVTGMDAENNEGNTTGDRDVAGSWEDALSAAREAGIPVVLMDPRKPVDDPTLYAAICISTASDGTGDTGSGDTGSADTAESVPLETALLSIVNDRAHSRTIRVSLSQPSQEVRP